MVLLYGYTIYGLKFIINTEFSRRRKLLFIGIFIRRKKIMTREIVYSMNATKRKHFLMAYFGTHVCLMVFYDHNLEIHGCEHTV